MRFLLFTLCSGVMTLSTAASTITINCPSNFPAEVMKFSGAPAGWTPFAPYSLEVLTADIMYGPPSSYKLAVPTTYRESKRHIVATWGLSPRPEDPKWLQCGYGRGAEVTLSTQLPANVSECTVTRYKDAEGNVEKVEATCKLTPSKPAP